MDLEQIFSLLRRLPPRQEKVIRMCFGPGCRRAHSVAEVAEQFGVSAKSLGGLMGEALRQLAAHGVTQSHLREAAQRQQNQSEAMTIAANARRKCSSSRTSVHRPSIGAAE